MHQPQKTKVVKPADFNNQSTLKIGRTESLHNWPLHMLNQLQAFEDKLCHVRNTALQIPHNKRFGQMVSTNI